MTFKTLIDIFLTSIPGTVVMTLFMYVYSSVSGKETRVIHIFGSMLTGDIPIRKVSKKAKAVLTGGFAHFLVGFTFAFVYYMLIYQGFIKNDFKNSFLTGILSGVSAIIIWRVYIFLYFHPPRISRLHYFIALFIAHIFFAVTTFYSFQLFFK